MIYLASPYSHPSPAIVDHRFEQACLAVADLVRRGEVPYSPIVHFHPVAIRQHLPGDFAYWQRVNFQMLSRAERMMILELDGWDTSIGVAAETDYALANNIPVEPFRWQK